MFICLITSNRPPKGEIPSEVIGYSSWQQLSGYFDGDGSVELKAGVFVLRFAVTWSDTYLPQLEHIAEFLRSQNIVPSRIRLGKSTIGRSAWHLSVWKFGGQLQVCKSILPYLDKKRVQVKTVIDYLEDRLSGEDVMRIFREEHQNGKWAGRPKNLPMPWSRAQGLELAHSAFVSGATKANFRRHQHSIPARLQ
jgi:LAGLIDADG DNA endonuclease family protein